MRQPAGRSGPEPGDQSVVAGILNRIDGPQGAAPRHRVAMRRGGPPTAWPAQPGHRHRRVSVPHGSLRRFPGPGAVARDTLRGMLVCWAVASASLRSASVIVKPPFESPSTSRPGVPAAPCASSIALSVGRISNRRRRRSSLTIRDDAPDSSRRPTSGLSGWRSPRGRDRCAPRSRQRPINATRHTTVFARADDGGWRGGGILWVRWRRCTASGTSTVCRRHAAGQKQKTPGGGLGG